MGLLGGQFAVTSTATNLTTALGLPSARFVRQVDIKNSAAALNSAYVGGSTVTNVPANAYVELAANQAWSDVAIDAPHVSTDLVFVVGTANAANILFIALVE